MECDETRHTGFPVFFSVSPRKGEKWSFLGRLIFLQSVVRIGQCAKKKVQRKIRHRTQVEVRVIMTDLHKAQRKFAENNKSNKHTPSYDLEPHLFQKQFALSDRRCTRMPVGKKHVLSYSDRANPFLYLRRSTAFAHIPRLHDRGFLPASHAPPRLDEVHLFSALSRDLDAGALPIFQENFEPV